MKQAQISVTIEYTPSTARLQQAVALVEFLLNGRIDSRELPAALVSVLLETSRLLETGALPGLADNYEAWEQVEVSCEVVAEQVRAALTKHSPLQQSQLAANGKGSNSNCRDIVALDFQEAERCQ